MPGLGPGIHEFACADAQIAEEESAILCRWMSLFLCKLVDARAKPWHDGGEVVCAGRGLRTAPGSGVLLRRIGASQLILTPMGPSPGMTVEEVVCALDGDVERRLD